MKQEGKKKTKPYEYQKGEGKNGIKIPFE